MAGQPGLSGGTAEEEPSLPRTPGAAPASRPPRLPRPAPSVGICLGPPGPSGPLSRTPGPLTLTQSPPALGRSWAWRTVNPARRASWAP